MSVYKEWFRAKRAGRYEAEMWNLEFVDTMTADLQDQYDAKIVNK